MKLTALVCVSAFAVAQAAECSIDQLPAGFTKDLVVQFDDCTRKAGWNFFGLDPPPVDNTTKLAAICKDCAGVFPKLQGEIPSCEVKFNNGQRINMQEMMNKTAQGCGMIKMFGNSSLPPAVPPEFIPAGMQNSSDPKAKSGVSTVSLSAAATALCVAATLLK